MRGARTLTLIVLVLVAALLLGATLRPSWQFPSGPVLFRDGTAGAPSLSAASDTNTGLFWPAADAVAATIGGAEGFRWHAAGFMAAVDNSFDLGTGAGSRFRHLHLQGSIVFARDNVGDIGGTTSTNRLRDLFVARDAHVTGYLHLQGTLSYGAHTVTIASNGVSGTANGETLSGLRALYLVDCLDGDGCTVTLAETGITVGTLVRIVNISTSGSANHNLTLSDAAPLHLAGALTLTAADTVTLIYVVNRNGDGNWYELGRSAN